MAEKSYVGAWPLATIRTKAGSMAQVYAGDPVPADITDEDLERLVEAGCFVEAETGEPVDAESTDETPVDEKPAASGRRRS